MTDGGLGAAVVGIVVGIGIGGVECVGLLGAGMVYVCGWNMLCVDSGQSGGEGGGSVWCVQAGSVVWWWHKGGHVWPWIVGASLGCVDGWRCCFGAPVAGGVWWSVCCLVAWLCVHGMLRRLYACRGERA